MIAIANGSAPPESKLQRKRTLTLVVRLPGVPGSPRRTRRRLPGIPGSKKKNFFFFFF